MRLRLMLTCLFSAIFLFNPIFASAADDKKDDALEIVTDYTYIIAPSDSQEKYEALGLYGAKYKAVVLAAKYLSHNSLLENFGKKQKEIFCLTADELQSAVIAKRLIENGSSYYVKIKSKVTSADFIRAQIKDLELEKEEMKFSLYEKMEQHVYKSIDPAQELSRAYRYIRRMRWRIAVIYLDHLEKKYPNWSEVYLAKAIAFYAIHEIRNMMEALTSSCSLGNREACEDIDALTQLHEKDIPLNEE